MIELNKSKLERVKPIFSEEIKKIKKDSLAPWQECETLGEVYLFPEKNNEEAIEFLFLLGALNFSYWEKNEDGGIYTWGVRTSAGEKVVDVFALAYTLADARERGWLQYDSDFYREITDDQLRKIFSDRLDGSCQIPMFPHRRLKIRELGEGLKQFSRAKDRKPSAGDFISYYETVPDLLAGLKKYFPLSFGDPFYKLPQLMVKMLIDRRDENMPPDRRFESSGIYNQATQFEEIDSLKAQPDYMLPLFCMRVGLWEMDDSIGKTIADKREIPMDHPYERALRQRTVETVEKIASAQEGSPGLNNCRVDSIMWQTAVKRCFPCECEGCPFSGVCDAFQGKNDRLTWTHHLTRTPNY